MIKYERNNLEEEQIEYVKIHEKNMTTKQMAKELNITPTKIGKIRRYLRYEIRQEKPFFDTSIQTKKFKKIPSLLYLYEISNDGVLRNVKSKRILKGTFDDYGYPTITFMNKSIVNHYGTHHKKRIHQLVMEVWGTKKPFPEAVIDHIDRNKRNNNISNLRWVSSLDNRKNSVLWDSKPEKQYKEVRVNGQRFESISAAAHFIAQQPDVRITYKNVMDRMWARRKNILGYEIEYII